MKKIFITFLLSIMILLSCYPKPQIMSDIDQQVYTVRTNKVYSLPKSFTVREVPDNAVKKEELKSAISQWNKWLKYPMFKYESDFLSSLRASNLILIFDGDAYRFCNSQLFLLGYAQARFEKNKHFKIKNGTIKLCKSNLSFLRSLDIPDEYYKMLSQRTILIHELGHFLIEGHIEKSNIMRAKLKSRPVPNKFDIDVLFESIKKNISK